MNLEQTLARVQDDTRLECRICWSATHIRERKPF